MQYRSLGSSGIEASVVGLGTWAIGGWMWGGTDEQESIRAIHAALDAGINLIDTAPVYGFGRSEEIVGRAIKDRRDKVVLATKCGLVWHVREGEHFFSSDDSHVSPDATQYHVHKCLKPEVIRYEIEHSLQRLNVDCIDVYQTHWQDKTTPIADSMEELLKLKAEGKIRAIGCCNATPAQMDDYRALGPLEVDQERYSMLDREHETANLPYCADHRVAFFAYAPLSSGLLTGKMGADRVFKAGDLRLARDRFSPENRMRVQQLLDRIRPIADGHGATIGQVVIAWTVAQPGCSHALVGARHPDQALENARAGTIRLSEEELKTLRAAVEECGNVGSAALPKQPQK